MLVDGDLVGDVGADLGEVFLRHGAELVMADTPGTGQHHPRSLVVENISF